MRRSVKIGEKYGRLEVLSFEGVRKYGKLYWRCKCSCGEVKVVGGPGLLNGDITSCGCYHREVVTTHGMTGTGTFKSWESMKQRCLNPNAPDYPNWGGKGITVCDRWLSFQNFLDDMGVKPSNDHSLDRYPNKHGNYSPDNCRWASRSEQQRNKRNSIWLTINGETRHINDWVKDAIVTKEAMQRRYKEGWKHEDIVFKPRTDSRAKHKGDI